AMRVLAGRLDPRVVGAKAGAADRVEGQRAVEAEARHGRLDRLGVHAGIDQGPERHVARDPAETVEIGDAHALPLSDWESQNILAIPPLAASPESAAGLAIALRVLAADDSLLFEQPEDRALDQKGRRQGLRQVLTLAGRVPQGRAGEEPVLREGHGHMLQ